MVNNIHLYNRHRRKDSQRALWDNLSLILVSCRIAPETQSDVQHKAEKEDTRRHPHLLTAACPHILYKHRHTPVTHIYRQLHVHKLCHIHASLKMWSMLCSQVFSVVNIAQHFQHQITPHGNKDILSCNPLIFGVLVWYVFGAAGKTRITFPTILFEEQH